MNTNHNVFKWEARVLKSMGSESRLQIVERLSRGECSVKELGTLVGSDQSTVSKHLAILRNMGIVEDRRDGSMVYYRLAIPSTLNMISCARQILSARPV